MEHYWNAEVGDDFKPELFDFTFNSMNYSMYSSSGVFSSLKADHGSLFLTSVLVEEVKKYMEGLSSSELGFFNALDVGSGYGLISLLLADSIAAYKGDMIDVSPRAIRLSEMNINKFALEDRLKVFESDKYDKIDGKYDIIYTNPPIRTGKKNVHEILEGSFHHLKDGGKFYAVMRKSHGAKSAVKKLNEVYSNCEVIKKDKGFYLLCSSK